MNQEVLNEVHKGDLPQRVRNIMNHQISDTDRDLTRLKMEINNFCWMFLPGNKTIREAEIIACKIFQIMTDGTYPD